MACGADIISRLGGWDAVSGVRSPRPACKDSMSQLITPCVGKNSTGITPSPSDALPGIDVCWRVNVALLSGLVRRTTAERATVGDIGYRQAKDNSLAGVEVGSAVSLQFHGTAMPVGPTGLSICILR
jgi:hypothetical protein